MSSQVGDPIITQVLSKQEFWEFAVFEGQFCTFNDKYIGELLEK